ncbi:uncharacterized protein [Notamacropus eugenii]|uniref:uncharacterized protein n=1 Tax=Notamacropus eugenii TaxID=9315 RepID=UPI003B685CBC
MAKQILVYKRNGKGVWEDLDGSGQKRRHGSFFLPPSSSRTEREGAGRAAGVALLARRGAGRPALRESVPPRLEDRRIGRSIADCTDLGRALAPPATRAQLLWLHMRSSTSYEGAAPLAPHAQLLWLHMRSSTSYEGAAPLATHAQLHQLRGGSSSGSHHNTPSHLDSAAKEQERKEERDSHPPKTGTKRGFSLTPDNDVFEYLAYTYSSKNPEMKTGNFCEKSINFPDGITNGYLWYPLKGGMQDYNYIWAQCFEITLEVSCCKYPPEENLPDFWNKKRDSLISFMKQVHLGIKGQVFDVNKNPIPNVIVEAKGRNHICPFRTNKFGEYYLLLLPGSYTINVSI